MQFKSWDGFVGGLLLAPLFTHLAALSEQELLGTLLGKKKEERSQLPLQTFPAIFILKSKNSRPKGKLR